MPARAAWALVFLSMAHPEFPVLMEGFPPLCRALLKQGLVFYSENWAVVLLDILMLVWGVGGGGCWLDGQPACHPGAEEGGLLE